MTDQRRRLLIDLCGVMAYGELSAFERMSSDARFSPTLHDRAVLGRLAVAEFGHFEIISGQLDRLGADVETAMKPFQASIDAFHNRTRPADWYESLMKAYVVGAVSSDTYLALGRNTEPELTDLIRRVQDPPELAGILQERIKAVLVEDPKLSSRLALWGRRLVGESLTQTRRMIRERAFPVAPMDPVDPVATVDAVVPVDPVGDAPTSALISHLTREHSRRMNILGLTA